MTRYIGESDEEKATICVCVCERERERLRDERREGRDQVKTEEMREG